MGPFTLSVPSYRLGVHSRNGRHHDASAQPDKEARSQSPSDIETQLSSSSRLPSESINPLSHSPDTLRQLALAGLSPEDELPSRLHKGFPHKPLPIRSKNLRRRKDRDTRSQGSLYESDGGDASNGGSETDTTVTSQQQRRRKTEDIVHGTQHSARIRHLNTMTAIMHRCLRDGDIVRAKRAFGLLVRTKDVDVRIDNLWAIGSEILMRDGEQEEEEAIVTSEAGKPSSVLFREKTRADPSAPSDTDTDSDTDFGETTDEEEVEIEDDDGNGEDAKRDPPPPQRWGTAANAARVKVYLETLAQHHPYDAHRPGPASAVDFWPALFSIELYNLDAEFQEAAHQIYVECGFPPSSSPFSSRSASPDGDRMELDDDYDMDMYGGNDPTSRGRGRRKAERGYGDDGEGDGGGGYDDEASTTRHKALSSLRASTQRGALEITARMDGILGNLPYSTHAELLRLRGHASLFIADLYLPPRVTERYQRREGGSRTAQTEQGTAGMGGTLVSLREAERRLRRHVRTPEERVALARRGEEQETARGFFRRAVAAKGWVEEWVVRFLDEEEEEEG
ncbi:hypothetical protein GGR55DRAFT_52163 [Xylaria sp. FL0064]|nr:hypothetical protein GGR55DRAFT_52163 [Xylaria sp. FL0064]